MDLYDIQHLSQTPPKSMPCLQDDATTLLERSDTSHDTSLRSTCEKMLRDLPREIRDKIYGFCITDGSCRYDCAEAIFWTNTWFDWGYANTINPARNRTGLFSKVGPRKSLEAFTGPDMALEIAERFYGIIDFKIRSIEILRFSQSHFLGFKIRPFDYLGRLKVVINIHADDGGREECWRAGQQHVIDQRSNLDMLARIKNHRTRIVITVRTSYFEPYQIPSPRLMIGICEALNPWWMFMQEQGFSRISIWHCEFQPDHKGSGPHVRPAEEMEQTIQATTGRFYYLWPHMRNSDDAMRKALERQYADERRGDVPEILPYWARGLA